MSASQTEITRQFSIGQQRWKLWAGDRQRDEGRIQIWTSTHQPRSATSSSFRGANGAAESRERPTSTSSIPSVASRSSRRAPSSLSQRSRQTTESFRTENSAAPTLTVYSVRVNGNGTGTVIKARDPPLLVVFLQNMLLVVKGQQITPLRFTRFLTRFASS